MCLVQGIYRHDFKKVIFPVQENNAIRDRGTYTEHLSIAKSTGSPSFGIKGPSKLSEILDIPNSIVFDSMHLLYLGVNKSFLGAIIKRKLVNEFLLSSFTENVRVPHYFRRRPRNLATEFSLWKAQEHRIFLLYYAPFVFQCVRDGSSNHNSEMIFVLYYLLSTGVYLLYKENISRRDIEVAELCIKNFQRELINLFGESVKTITLHALQHIPEQTRRFGPLHCVSAMAFENLNRELKRSVTGTRG